MSSLPNNLRIRAKTYNMTNIEQENQRFLDIVNEQDEVVGSKSRSDIHRLGLLHREIHVWLFDNDKNIVFQKRGLHRQSAGLLDASVGGHTNEGEEYKDAAVREVLEETSVTISSEDLVLLAKIRGKSGMADSVNNFLRAIFIYKKPVSYTDIKKEDGIPGVGFQKLSIESLLGFNEEQQKMFDQFIFTDEIPEVIKYMNNI